MRGTKVYQKDHRNLPESLKGRIPFTDSHLNAQKNGNTTTFASPGHVW